MLSREERLEKLKEDGKWAEEENSVFGLPKVKVETVSLRKKASEEEEEGEEAEAEEPTEDESAGE